MRRISTPIRVVSWRDEAGNTRVTLDSAIDFHQERLRRLGQNTEWDDWIDFNRPYALVKAIWTDQTQRDQGRVYVVLNRESIDAVGENMYPSVPDKRKRAELVLRHISNGYWVIRKSGIDEDRYFKTVTHS